LRNLSIFVHSHYSLISPYIYLTYIIGLYLSVNDSIRLSSKAVLLYALQRVTYKSDNFVDFCGSMWAKPEIIRGLVARLRLHPIFGGRTNYLFEKEVWLFFTPNTLLSMIPVVLIYEPTYYRMRAKKTPIGIQQLLTHVCVIAVENRLSIKREHNNNVSEIIWCCFMHAHINVYSIKIWCIRDNYRRKKCVYSSYIDKFTKCFTRYYVSQCLADNCDDWFSKFNVLLMKEKKSPIDIYY